jgi:simple sugar transport system ATP-binding protein
LEIKEKEILIGDTIIDMRSIKKSFPGTIANDSVNFQLKKGEIHALLGENGAGKTTLMNILYGLYTQDEGEIFIKGKKVDIKSPKHAIELGIGMVHQHFMLVDVFSVLENIVLGLKELKLIIPKKKISHRLEEISKTYGLKLDANAKIWQLSAGEKQRVEIIKALYRGAEILILDEPTSVLAESEIKSFIAMLRRMASEGKSIIFISHKLNEVLSVSDRVTVLRKGKVEGTVITSKTNKRELTQLTIGKELISRPEKAITEKGEVVLEVNSLKAFNDKGIENLKGVSFKVSEGEIFGIIGIAGNGQKELLEGITGLRKVTSGEVYLKNEKITNKSPRIINMKNVAHIPEERIEMGIVPNMTVSENLILKNYNQVPFVKDVYKGRIKLIHDYEEISSYSQKLVEEYDILTPNINIPVKMLSGGNIQRLILARELSSNPSLIIATHPTYGLDINATEFIRSLLLKEREKGAAILLVSEDLNEIIALSDRIAVIYEGKLVDIIDAENVDLEEIGLMMIGENSINSNGGFKFEDQNL